MTGMWACPECGRSFASRNQAHTCAALGDLDQHFARASAQVRATFDAVLAAVCAVGPVQVLAEKTRIAIPAWAARSRASGFARCGKLAAREGQSPLRGGADDDLVHVDVGGYLVRDEVQRRVERRDRRDDADRPRASSVMTPRRPGSRRRRAGGSSASAADAAARSVHGTRLVSRLVWAITLPVALVISRARSARASRGRRPPAAAGHARAPPSRPAAAAPRRGGDAAATVAASATPT